MAIEPILASRIRHVDIVIPGNREQAEREPGEWFDGAPRKRELGVRSKMGVVPSADREIDPLLLGEPSERRQLGRRVCKTRSPMESKVGKPEKTFVHEAPPRHAEESAIEMNVAEVKDSSHGHCAGASSPEPSPKPNRTFKHWMACPAAPLTRLSIALIAINAPLFRSIA